MRLLGVTELSQLHPGMVNTLSIDHEVPGDNIDPERG
jgi:hypothetical protein